MVDNKKIEEALTLWIELSGVDPGTCSFSTSTYDIVQMHRAIKEAFELDESMITGCLLLDYCATIYFSERSFSVMELLDDPEKTSEYVSKASRCFNLIRTPEFKDICQSFSDTLSLALKNYGFYTEPVQQYLGDKFSLGLVRRDALRGIAKLRVDQFLKGEPEPASVNPKYNTDVYQFWNVNSLLSAACTMPSGVSLCLIRDPDELQSYFAFVIRNGGNVFVLSDVPEYTHPLQAQMSRRPDREFDARAFRHHFPYNLLNFTFDEEQERIYSTSAEQGEIVPYQKEVFPLQKICNLLPDEVVWVTMMFDLIVEKFWTQSYQAKELSYTTEMIQVETPLLEQAQANNLPVANYQKLGLKALTVTDIHSDVVTEAQVGKSGRRGLRWMEDFYADKVNTHALNLFKRGPRIPFFKDGDTETIRDLTAKEFKSYSFMNKHDTIITSIESLNPSRFGTKDEVSNDRMFIARYNLAQNINHLANLDYEAQKEKIYKWYKKAVTKNINYFLTAAGQHDQIWIDIPGTDDDPLFEGLETTANERRNHDRLGNKVHSGETKFSYRLMAVWNENDLDRLPDSYALDYCGGMANSTIRFNNGYYKGRYHCCVNGTRATYRAVWLPQTAYDLALMAGCKISDLPPLLQNWKARTKHRGNSILNRIDPLDWNLKNPWERETFAVVLSLSIRGRNSARKGTVS